MTEVRFWDVGAVKEASLPMGAAAMQAHLAADWLPGLSPLSGAPLVSWPARLTIPYYHPASKRNLLRLRRRVAWSDRQWNGFLSWMVGVCGARQYLARSGYLWIAPLSAFYADKRKRVDIDPKWPTPFRPGDLSVTSDPNNPSRLMPDYIALRKGPGADDWHLALVEAKGTEDALDRKISCPQNWHDQARNAIVQYKGTKVAPDRYLVTATRCAPGKVREFTTVLQLRAWNHQADEYSAPTGVAIEAASIAMLGICNNFGLRVNARCLLKAQGLRRRGPIEHMAHLAALERHDELELSAIDELKRLCDCDPSDSEAGWTPAYLQVPGLDVGHRAELLPTAVATLRLLCQPFHDDGFVSRFNQLSRALVPEMEAARGESDQVAVVPPGLMLVSDVGAVDDVGE